MRKILLLLALVAIAHLGQAQKLIVNEVSQGPVGIGPNGTGREYVELLVIGTRTCTDSTLDIRGWIVDDNNGWVQTGSGTGIAPGAIRFANVANWQKVPYGSIILIYNDFDKNVSITVANDGTDANHDYVYVLPASSNLLERHLTLPSPPSSASFSYPTTGWSQGTASDSWSTVALANGGDAILTVNPASPNTAQFSFAYAIGSAATATVWVTDMPGGTNRYLSDDNYTQASSWMLGTVGTDETPGRANGGTNTSWIDLMRVQAGGLIVAPINSTNGNTICVGGTTTLTNLSTIGVWSSSNTGVATVTGAGLVTGVAPGAATISYTITLSGCTGVATYNITVVAGANAGTVSGGPNVCTGQSATYTSTGTAGGTWSSGNTAFATVNPGTGVVTGVAAGTTNITYTVGSGSCVATASAPVTVVQTPVVANTTGNFNVCIGGTSQLSNATPGGVWSSSAPGIASISASGLVTGIAPGNFFANYTVTNGACPTTVAYSMAVNANPDAGSITGNLTLCNGTTSQLANATATGSGTWTSSAPAVATISATGLVTAVGPGNATITYTSTNAAGCTATTAVTVTVTAGAIAQPIGGPSSVCVGNTITLTNPTPGGSWSSGNTAIATIDPATGVLTGAGAGTATISYNVGSGLCTANATTTITVNAVPVLQPTTGPNFLCAGGQGTITNPAINGSGVWTLSNNTVVTLVPSMVTGGPSTALVTAIGAGTVTIDLTVTVNGCSATTSFTITVNALPVVAPITGNNTVCVGGTTTFTSATPGGTWSSGSPAIATISATGVVSGVSAGISTISYTITSGGCSNTATKNISVAALPVVGPITGTTNVCVGSTTTLSNSSAIGVSTWSSSQPGVATVTNAGLVTGVSAGTTTITSSVQNADGCSASATTTVVVSAAPVLNPIAAQALCVGGSVTLSPSIGGGSWTSSNPAIATVTNAGVVTGAGNGTAQLTYTVTSGGCTASQQVAVTVNSISVQLAASATTITQGQSVTLTPAWTGTAPFTVTAWTPAALFPNQTAATQTVSPASTTTFSVSGRDAAGCTATGSVTVNVQATFVNDLFVPNYFTPNGDGRNDILYIYGSSITALELRIFNQWGEAVFTGTDKGHGWDGTASGKMQPVGVYMYVARVTMTNGETRTLKGSINLIR